MFGVRAAVFCGLLTTAAMASAEELAPVALNSLSSAPSHVASLKVMNQQGLVIGQALKIQTDQDGRPAALAFRASNGNTVVISAGATAYDGKELIAGNDQPQIAALSGVHTAAK
jgi:hypothetical protein